MLQPASEDFDFLLMKLKYPYMYISLFSRHNYAKIYIH